MHVVIFEGSHWRFFAPLSLSRPVFQLYCGLSTLLEKQVRATVPSRLTLWVRPEMEDYCRRFVVPTLPCPVAINAPLDNEPALLLSGRTLHLSHFEHGHDDYVVVDDTPNGPVIRMAWVHRPGLNFTDIFDRTDSWLSLQDLPHSMPQSRLPEYVWDLIAWNEEAIVGDFIARHEISSPHPPGPYHVINPDNLWNASDVKLSPGCVLDGSKGPVILSNHCQIGPHAVLQGPCYIGPHSQVSPHAWIKPGTTIGPMCKVGGEIANSIVMGFTNKPHDGYLGDSYLGEWINFGAGSVTSNLKNTYGDISMPMDGKTVKTGKRFLGSIIGDHTKVAVGTRLNTGTYIGYCSMIATSKRPPRVVPSFSFMTDQGNQPYDRDKAAVTMRSVFNRRQRLWTPADDAMNQYIAATAPTIETPLD